MFRLFRHAVVTAGLLLLLGVPFMPVSEANINSCSASVSPSTVNPGATVNFQIQVTNSDSDTINWIRITRPSADFTIVGNESPGWGGSTSEEYAYESNGALSPGQTMTVSVTAVVANTTAPSADWTVEATDTPGQNLHSCGGTLGTDISGDPADVVPPNIYNISVSKVRTDSVVVSWVTSEPATSQVNYGYSDQYGNFSSEDTSLKTNHSVQLNGLSTNQAYHYQVVSKDSADNVAVSGDNTFLTALTDPAEPDSSSSSVIKTKIPLKTTPTEKIPPVANIETNLDKPFSTAPTISGKASDNEALAGIDYSVDGGVNWLQVDKDQGLGSKNATFSFKPLNLEDGNYEVVVRAIDTSGNIGLSAKKTLVIDRLPPQVGGSTISSGPQVFQPNDSGVIYALAGVDQKVTFSAVGGPTTISINAKRLSGQGKEKEFNLTKSADTGLWSGVISFEDPGAYVLNAESVDGAGNKTAKDIGTIQVLAPGRILSDGKPLPGATVALYYLEPSTNSWTIWDGLSYGQANPQKTDANGRFNLFVPPGKYYLKADAKNYRTLISNIFELDQSMPILSDLSMKEAINLNIGRFTLHVPPFSNDKVNLSSPELPPGQVLKAKQLVGKQSPDFILQNSEGETVRSLQFNGKPTLITFLSSWSPPSQEQMKVLDELQKNQDINIVPIMSQEKAGKINAINQTSGRELSALVDPDGVTLAPFMVQALPTHYVLDRKGVVKKVMIGVSSKEKILNALAGG